MTVSLSTVHILVDDPAALGFPRRQPGPHRAGRSELMRSGQWIVP